MNNYDWEFSHEITLEKFMKWMTNGVSNFGINLHEWTEEKPLRDWIKTFLMWCEYEDNK